MITHIPVLTKEVLKYLDPKPDENFIDATIDGGGHSAAILKKTEPNGKILGVDMDSELIEAAKLKMTLRGVARDSKNEKLKIDRVILVRDNFKNLKEIVKKFNFKNISGILFDLGMSSWHLERSGRGFSFKRDEPLDMRFSIEGNSSLTAREIINVWPIKELEKILKEYGEERYSKNIAERIIEERKRTPILTTLRLAEIVQKAVPRRYERGRIHPATRTFQALRIAVNQELENLREVLPQAVDILNTGGRIVVISFHSLEDRIVKLFFRQEERKERVKILTKKPVMATEVEIGKNPRARSAKLRTAEKI